MSKIEIKRINSKWLINGKLYVELSDDEKEFFNQFLVEMKIIFESEMNQKQKLIAS